MATSQAQTAIKGKRENLEMELKGKGYSAGHSSGTATPLSSDSEEDAIKNNDNQKMEDIIFALRTKIRLDAKNFQEENEKIRNEASQKITELKESLQDREDEITEIQIKHKREIREKIKQIDELERNIQKAEKGISVLQETNKELLKNKAEQSEEREKVMTEVAMLKEELNDVYKSLEQMKKEMNDMQSSSEQSKSDLKESKPKEGSSDSRIEMLGADLLKANSEIDRLIKLHSKEIQKVREQYKKIKSQNDGLKSDISELLTEMKEMRKEVKEVKEFQMPQGNKN